MGYTLQLWQTGTVSDLHVTEQVKALSLESRAAKRESWSLRLSSVLQCETPYSSTEWETHGP